MSLTPYTLQDGEIVEVPGEGLGRVAGAVELREGRRLTRYVVIEIGAETRYVPWAKAQTFVRASSAVEDEPVGPLRRVTTMPRYLPLAR